MKFEGISSVVTVSIKRGQKFLVLKDTKRGVWHFPSMSFDGNLNGNLDDTVKRVLRAVIDSCQTIDYLGSFLRNEEDCILIGYSFSIENFKGKVLTKNYKWVNESEIGDVKLNKNTSTFLKLHKDLI